jgi:hypothetical protein
LAVGGDGFTRASRGQGRGVAASRPKNRNPDVVITATQPRNDVFTRLGVVYTTANGYVSLSAPVSRNEAFTVRTEHQPTVACSGSFYPGGRPESGESGFFRYIRAAGTSCGRARQVTLGFIHAVRHNGNAFNEVGSIDGFDCVSTSEIGGDEVDVACTAGTRRVSFHVGS